VRQPPVERSTPQACAPVDGAGDYGETPFIYEDRIRCAALRGKVTTAADAALLIHDGMRVDASGFTRAGDAKAVPVALAERARQQDEPLRITLMTGASLGHDVDRMLTEAHVLARRLPFQVERLCATRSIAAK
jgi:succinyl-CoA:acetate CoA-transferase